MNESVTLSWVAKLLRAKTTTVVKWSDQGRIPKYRLRPDGRRLFSKQEILEWWENTKTDQTRRPSHQEILKDCLESL